MRSPSSTPDLVPDFDVTVHVVLDDFGRLGRAYREIDEAKADAATIVDDLLTGQFNDPVRIVAFNTSEGWARDVSEDLAWEVVARAQKEVRELSRATRSFVEYHIGTEEVLRLEAGLF